jgi:hypothetical protein
MPLAEYRDWLPTLAALLHLVQLPAMFVARRVLDWQGELARLAPINQRILAVIAGGIMVCVLGLSMLVLALHGSLLESRAGVGLCVFLSVFWAYRGAVQFWVYARIWPAGERWAHHGLCVLFVVLTTAYALSASLA